MTELFTISITTKQDLGADPSFFTQEGELVGRTLRCHKNTFDPDNIFFVYDVESCHQIFENLSTGKDKLYNLSNYSVTRSTVRWIRDD